MSFNKICIIILATIILFMSRQVSIAQSQTVDIHKGFNIAIYDKDNTYNKDNVYDDKNNKKKDGDILKNTNDDKYNNELASRSGVDKFKSRKYRVEKLIVTAYAPFDNKSGICNNGDPNTTATGTKPDWGTVAVNPNRFPYGTEFYIPGYGKGTARDTGGVMQADDNRIDVYVDTYAEAINWWGKRELEVIVYGDQ